MSPQKCGSDELGLDLGGTSPARKLCRDHLGPQHTKEVLHSPPPLVSVFVHVHESMCVSVYDLQC